MSGTCTIPAVDAVDAVDAAVRAALADDALVTDADRMVAGVESLLDSRTRLVAAIVARLRDAHRVEAVSRATGRTTRDWLITEMRLSPAEASRVMLLVRFLDAFPATDAALADARITADHAVVIVRALLRLRDLGLRVTVETHLLDFAADHIPGELAGFVDALLDQLGYDEDSGPRRERRLGDRGIGLTTTFAGNTVLDGTLTPDGAAIIAEALRAAATGARGGGSGDGPHCDHGHDHGAGDDGHGHGDDGDGDEDERTQRQRDHDALVEIARAYLAHHDEQPSFAGTPVGVIVAIPLEVLEQRLTTATATLLPSGAQISPDTARRLACDANLIPTVLSSRSDVLDLGESSRTFTAAIRRAAYLEQHGRCAFPRCRRRVADCHHIIWWSLGGRTSLDNAAWLCAFHHWLVHDGGWTLRRNADRSFTFTSPTGDQHTRQLTAA